LISDIELPDGTGLDLMRQLGGRGVPGVAMSGYGSGGDLRAGRGGGVSEHLTKPGDVGALGAASRRGTPAGRPAGGGRAAAPGRSGRGRRTSGRVALVVSYQRFDTSILRHWYETTGATRRL